MSESQISPTEASLVDTRFAKTTLLKPGIVSPEGVCIASDPTPSDFIVLAPWAVPMSNSSRENVVASLQLGYTDLFAPVSAMKRSWMSPPSVLATKATGEEGEGPSATRSTFAKGAEHFFSC